MTVWSRVAWVVALQLALLGAGTARASEKPRATGAPFWQEVAHRGQQRARALAEQARIHAQHAEAVFGWTWQHVCERALDTTLGSDSRGVQRGRQRALVELARQALVRRAHLDGALARLDRAVALDPNSAPLRYARASILAAWEEPGLPWQCDTSRRNPEAIADLQAVARLDPTFRASEVAFELGVLWSRSGEPARAAAAYERAITLALDGEHVVALANLAEMTMLAGELDDAVALYQRALQGAGEPRSRALARWGLAVALDRLGEHEAAIAQARDALQAYNGRLDILRDRDVFFEPAHERHYYEALGHEALADKPGPAGMLALDAALESWDAFLRDGGAEGRFAEPARRNRARIAARIEAESPLPDDLQGKARRSRPR